MRQNSRPKPGSPPRAPDELQKIAGIGPGLARRLVEAGITGYRDLASLTPGQIADVLAGVVGVSPERIASQDWIGQARRLAGDVPTDPEGHQTYATFHVELLIDADNTVRRTKVRHYQTDAEDSWPGWDDRRLIAVIRGRAALDASTPPPTQPQRPAMSPIRVAGLGPAGEGTRGSFRLVSQPTAVRMTFQVGPIDGVGTGPVDFTTDVAARSLENSSRHALATTSGVATINQPLSLELTGPPLPPGMYGLEAVVVIFPHRHQPHDRPLCDRRIHGDLLYVASHHAQPQPR